MKALDQIVKFFRSSIFAEYLPMFFIVAVVFAVVLVMTDKKNDQEKMTNVLSCANSSMPSIGITEEYENYRNDFETYADNNIGFLFKYPPHLEVFSIISHTVLSYREDENDSHGKIIVSIGLNDENMTAEEWLFSHNSGYLQSKNHYGDCYKTLIGGQEAVYTDGGMWVVVNTPDSRYRLSIADLTTGDASPPFTEMGIVIESLKFLSSAENSNTITPLPSSSTPIDEILSPDKDLTAFIKSYPTNDVADKYGAYGLWIRNSDTGEEKLLVKTGDVSNYSFANSENFPFSGIYGLNSPAFSLDSKKVYFMSHAWTTSNAIFSVDISTGKLHFISDGKSLEVLSARHYKGNLKVLKHKYYGPPDYGSYDHYYIITDSGKELNDLVGTSYINGEEIWDNNSDNFLPLVRREIIEWEGQVHSYMTYGRRVFKNLDESSNYKYFIVEPNDYTEDGSDKYSPTTRSLGGNERVKIVGTIAHYCWWNEEEYDGCVPWIDAENMEVINRDE